MSNHDSNKGVVQSCTLNLKFGTLTKFISVVGRNYCAAIVEKNKKSHFEAVSLCKALNAKLPLPKSSSESVAFYNAFPFSLWVDLTDPGSTGKKENWKDSNGASPQYVQASSIVFVVELLIFRDYCS